MGSWQALPCLQLGCWPELVAQKSIFWVVSSYKNASFLAFFTFSRSLKHPHAYQDIKVHTYIQNASMNLLTWWSLILQKKLHLVFNLFFEIRRYMSVLILVNWMGRLYDPQTLQFVTREKIYKKSEKTTVKNNWCCRYWKKADHRFIHWFIITKNPKK